MSQYRTDTRTFDQDNKTRYDSVMLATQAHPFGTQTDAFGRLRMSTPMTLFDSVQQFSSRTDLWDTTLTGSATSTHLPNESSTKLLVTTSSSDSAIRETRKVFTYQPGKSLLVLNSFVMAAGKTGLRQRIGYFTTNNGIFLEKDGTSVYLVKRTYISGSVVDTRISQSDWNVDQLQGSGPTKITLDLSLAQLFFIDIEWLGVGSVRCGFIIDGVTIVCHAFHHANLLDSVFMTTANLPVRVEITNTGTTASNSYIKQICSTVITEGGHNGTGILSRAGTGITPVSLTTPGTLVFD